MQLELFGSSSTDRRAFEKQACRKRGIRRVAGIDEVGRGPLAGPVVAAVVILPPDADLPGVHDSKQLTATRRETCYEEILSCAEQVSVGCVEAPEIDRINILQATFHAMLKALDGLVFPPDYLLIDGPYILPVPIPQKGIPRGDQRSLSIAAASIVAKVYRDRLMCEHHSRYPVYDFHRNKGYGTRAHLDALRRHGPCPLHRLTFRGVIQK